MKIDNVISFTSYPISKQEIKDLKKEIKKNNVFLYDVDTTHGFMDQDIFVRKNGVTDGFPVTGADKIVPVLQKIKDMALNVLPKVETVDAHKFGDPELEIFKSISDIHSEKGTYGAEKIPETIFKSPDFLIEVEQDKFDVPSADEIRAVLNDKGVIRLEKNETSPLKYGDMFSQMIVPNEKAYEFFENLKKSGANIALIYGVATDYCVKDATYACKKFGIKPIIIVDAVKEAGKNSLVDDDDYVYKDVAIISSSRLEKILKG